DRDGPLAPPAELGTVEVEAGGDDVCACFVEDPVVGGGALPWLPAGPEAVEDAQLVELREPQLGAPSGAEVEPAQLLGSEDAVLVAGERDQAVTLGQARGERGD